MGSKEAEGDPTLSGVESPLTPLAALMQIRRLLYRPCRTQMRRKGGFLRILFPGKITAALRRCLTVQLTEVLDRRGERSGTPGRRTLEGRNPGNFSDPSAATQEFTGSNTFQPHRVVPKRGEACWIFGSILPD
jgi:hypothetical protein